MTADELSTLCHRASLELSLPDPYALGKGHTVTLDGVHLEIQHKAPRPHFLLLAEIARFSDTQRAAVHEHLLALQLSTADHPNLRFGFHPKRHTTLVCLTSTPPRGDARPEAWLVRLIRDTAQQVLEWRRELRDTTAATLDDQPRTAALQHAGLRA
ncbi:MAG: hypothetical protein GTN84_13560 [Hydrogenophaga sp.]|uniref:hypothetical protein n=1 Tax=Hydrogenophaga sp. TaxID=1904254 RepID=UPI0016909CF4|nr:hypothetical protein [Hydrogenophaga sp.]NIU60367.1 hypothetical protein [Stutzerimonas stutzeri]NIM42154.1 hypothetical protein [Hydrogenophaga sp.]NIN27447.1 hypothetical protein [Hydrogenophaga sp.]NIN32148.1 hypothetical protein [Hydrogenophaga sp.]NIN56400.1 hypothetical protein [Hydrogenophaga sp.]